MNLKFSRLERTSNYLLSLSVCLFLFAAYSGSLFLWDSRGIVISPSGTYFCIFGVVLLLVSLSLNNLNYSKLRFVPSGFATGLLILYLSDWLLRGYNLLQGPLIRGEILILAVFVFILLKYRNIEIISWLLPLSILIFFLCFISISAGRTIFSDDHATFFYRLAILKKHFPYIPFYNPLWNGGIDARDFFATGALNLFLLASPLIYSFEVESIYNLIITILIFLFVPAVTYFAAKLENLSNFTSAIAAILALTSSLIWYRWALVYGTIGFITSASLIPLVIILTSKVLSRNFSLSIFHAGLLVIAFSLMLLWSASGLVFIPLIVWSLFQLPRLIKKKYCLMIAVLLVVINLPWISIFWTASNVSSFLTSEKEVSTTLKEEILNAAPEKNSKRYKHRSQEINLKESLEVLRETVISVNPLVLFLSVPGVFMLLSTTRTVYILTSIWLLVLGSVLVPVKPQLELDRMLIILSLILCIPAARAIQEFFKTTIAGQRRWYQLLLPALVGGFLITGPFSVANIILGRSTEAIYFKDNVVSEMIHAIKLHKGSGRTLYSGCVVHQLSGGHLAPLILKTDSPLMASSHVHSLWWYTDIIPREFRGRKKEGVDEFLNLYNVTSVFAHEPFWRNYFDSDENFEEAWRGGPFRLYKRKNYSGSYFIEGSGEIVSQITNSLTLKVESESALIKFNYFPFLRSSGCEIVPEKISSTITFIRLKNCTPGDTIEIKAKSGFERVFDGFKT